MSAQILPFKRTSSIPCDVIQGNFFPLQELSAEQREQAQAKFSCPPEWDFLYLVSARTNKVIARLHVSAFSSDELHAVGMR